VEIAPDQDLPALGLSLLAGLLHRLDGGAVHQRPHQGPFGQGVPDLYLAVGGHQPFRQLRGDRALHDHPPRAGTALSRRAHSAKEDGPGSVFYVCFLLACRDTRAVKAAMRGRGAGVEQLRLSLNVGCDGALGGGRGNVAVPGHALPSTPRRSLSRGDLHRQRCALHPARPHDRIPPGRVPDRGRR